MFPTRMLFAAAAKEGARHVKPSTGIVGLIVQPRAKEILQELYARILTEVQEIPEDAIYRDCVERTTRYRLSVVNKHDDFAAIEDEIDRGQMEELIESAEGELTLIPYFIENKLWVHQWTTVEEDQAKLEAAQAGDAAEKK